MSVHNLIDGSASLSLPTATTFSYTAPSIESTVPLNLTFMNVGNMCTMRIDTFATTDTTTSLNFDMSGMDPTYVPSKPISGSFIYVVGGVRTLGSVLWTPSNSTMSLSFNITPATDDRQNERPQTINYKLN